MATMLPIRKPQPTMILPSAIKKLNTELETINTKRGKILSQLKESLEWREMKFKEFVNALKDTYFQKNKNQPNSYIYKIDVDSLKITTSKLSSKSNAVSNTVIFNTISIIGDSRPVSMKILGLPYEADKVKALVSNGDKVINVSEMKEIQNEMINQKIKKMKDEIKKLETQKLK